jgi:hypothetical protein
MRATILAAGLLGALLALPALAQTPPPAPAGAPPAPHRVRGTIVSFDAAGQMLTVKGDDGQTVTVGVIPQTRYIYNEKRSVSDIHQGDFVGSAALKGSDGKLHAQEVHIFPDSLRGMGEGQYGMNDNNPNRSMTNATVMQVAAVSGNGDMMLSYHGAGAAGDANCTGHAAAGGNGCTGTTEIEVAAGVPVIGLVAGDQSSLVPGAAVAMLVVTTPDGKQVTPGMTVEHNGIKPML